MDREAFHNALLRVTLGGHVRAGIGTYGEKTVHAVLKNYFEPYGDSHEQRVGGYIADIVGENGIIEIQTAGFGRMRKKLESFLAAGRVTVVYPIPLNKWIIPIDPETGETGKRRKSPRKGSPYDIFPELYGIKPFLRDENLRFCIVMLDIEEYRRPPETSGLRRGRRKGWTVYDRVPAEIHEEIHLDSLTDWDYFIPSGLPEEYTSKEFAAKAGINSADAGLVLNVLSDMGAVSRAGKSGRSYLYRTVI